MKRIILSLLILISCCLTAWGQNGKPECNQGWQDLLPLLNPLNVLVGLANSFWQLSYDPNEIIGPAGYDSVRWVSINDVLNYTILFENDPEFATAAAQKVDVRFDFPNRSAQGDASLAKKAWMKGFGIGGYSFANLSFPVAKPSNAYQQRIDLKDSLGYYVDLIAGLDVARQQGFWTFTTIDPETGYAPWQAEMGLLPVNDSTHVGEGAVTFQLKPYEGLHTGDTISIQAKIVFDQNDTIPTNRWCNKIDAGMPTSRVSAEVDPTPNPSPEMGGEINAYKLRFEAADDEGGSGVKNLLLYLANHNGIYEEIDTVAVDSVLTFPVEAGKQYKLYSIAVDNTGNREPAKMEPDVILNFNLAPTDIALSDTIFQDDLAAGGYVGKLSSIDTEDNKTFTYALAEGDGAIHNDLFQITDDQLQIKNSFKCADEDFYKVRISTTDEGGMSFSKAFTLNLDKVLEKPRPDTLIVNICEGETCLFHGEEYDKTGIYRFTKDNEFMCDSLYVLNLTVLPRQELPFVTIEGTHTLVSSAAKGNQWFKADGTPIDGATEQTFTPEEDGIYYVAVSNGTCYSPPSNMYQVVLTDKIDLTLNLYEGWNWISTSLNADNMTNAKQFIAPIAEYTSSLLGMSGELTNNAQDGFVGNLETLYPEEGYKIKMNQAVTHTWSGSTANPEATTVTLHKGWNWIGYVPILSQGLTDAFAELNESENAVVKCKDDFSTFTGGSWIGTLNELSPGRGYMYYADKEQSFTYPIKRVLMISDAQNANRRAAELTRMAAPWNYNEYQYQDNTTIIAKLKVNGSFVMEGTYIVGAFCGDECRGIGKYVDGRLFITVHGMLTNDKEITFKAVETISGQELDVNETVHFNGQMEGTYNSPLVLNAKEGTNNINIINVGYTIYPKPLRNVMYINGDIENIKKIYVLSAGGSKAMTIDGYYNDGIDVSGLSSGVYVVAIVTKNGQTKYEKVMKVH